jgi:hypothetical protein
LGLKRLIYVRRETWFPLTAPRRLTIGRAGGGGGSNTRRGDPPPTRFSAWRAGNQASFREIQWSFPACQPTTASGTASTEAK